MRILHLSDLHFGNHKSGLTESLKVHVKRIKPDVILATGDMVDQPQKKLLMQAKEYLLQLESLCTSSKNPLIKQRKIIAVPGNHDISFLGTFPVIKPAYWKVFGDIPTSQYFESEKVWIYGFDSTWEGGMGANGEIQAKSLVKFQKDYYEMENKYGEAFRQAYKIAALHHHPLPVKFNSKLSRWLILLNSGAFLEEMLKVGIDLVVHGHEHVQARAWFGKALKGMGSKQLDVLSVGSAFHKQPGNDHNRFNLIEIEEDGKMSFSSYEAQGEIFGGAPVETFDLQNDSVVDRRLFEKTRASQGYAYKKLIVITDLREDGDAKRFARFEDLTVEDKKSDRARSHKIYLPETSGYIDVVRASESEGQSDKHLVFNEDKEQSTEKKMVGTIEFGRSIEPGISLSYAIQWWAVNAFAMNAKQFHLMYASDTLLEYTHFQVSDPIEELVCVFSFPTSFALTSLQPYAAKKMTKEGKEVWERESGLEKILASSMEKGNSTAKFSVRYPRRDIKYGFQWNVPEIDSKSDPQIAGITEKIVDRLLLFHRQMPESEKKSLLALLASIGKFIREQFSIIPQVKLEVNLMTLDPQIRKMVNIGAVISEGLEFGWVDYSSIVFDYGEGVGGKSFKTNSITLYLPVDRTNQKDPDHYRIVAGVPLHAVLLSIPVSHPKRVDETYAVLNVGSPDKSCALRKLGAQQANQELDVLAKVQETLNLLCFEEFQKLFG